MSELGWADEGHDQVAVVLGKDAEHEITFELSECSAQDLQLSVSFFLSLDLLNEAMFLFIAPLPSELPSLSQTCSACYCSFGLLHLHGSDWVSRKSRPSKRSLSRHGLLLSSIYGGSWKCIPLPLRIPSLLSDHVGNVDGWRPWIAYSIKKIEFPGDASTSVTNLIVPSLKTDA